MTKKNDTSQGTGDKTDIGGKDKGAVNTPVENKEKPELTLAEATAFIESKGFVVNTKDQTEGIQELVENKNELLGLLAERKAAKASCVDVLVKNSNGTLTADDLAGFTLEKLEALAGQTTRVDNSLRGGGGVISTSSNDKNFMTNKDGSAYNYMGEENFAVDKEAN